MKTLSRSVNLGMILSIAGSESYGDKVVGQEGNSPDSVLRSQSYWQVKLRQYVTFYSHDVGLEASIIYRKRNSSVV